MTYAEVMTMVKALGDDVVCLAFPTRISVDINDFEGFDDDWDEISRDYDEDAIEEFLNTLEKKSNKVEKGFYSNYHFDDFVVCVGYTSYDI